MPGTEIDILIIIAGLVNMAQEKTRSRKGKRSEEAPMASGTGSQIGMGGSTGLEGQLCPGSREQERDDERQQRI